MDPSALHVQRDEGPVTIDQQSESLCQNGAISDETDTLSSPPRPAGTDARKGFVLPTLTVTALRAPKHRRLPPVLVANTDADANEVRHVAPFADSITSPPRSTRRNRAVMFSEVSRAAHSSGGDAPAIVSLLKTPAPPVATPALVTNVLRSRPGTANEENDVEDVLAILHWLACERGGLGEASYGRGLECLQALSQDAVSAPMTVATRPQKQPRAPTATSTGLSQRVRTAATSTHLRRSPEDEAQAPTSSQAGLACVLLREVIVIRLPRTVGDLPVEEKAHRARAMQQASHPTQCGNWEVPDGAAADVQAPFAVATLEAGRGIVALHIVELPLSSIPAAAAPPGRAQSNLLEILRLKCPEAFGDSVNDVNTLDAQLRLTTLKRPEGSPLFGLSSGLSDAQPFATLRPAFPEGKQVLGYEELKRHLAADASRTQSRSRSTLMNGVKTLSDVKMTNNASAGRREPPGHQISQSDKASPSASTQSRATALSRPDRRAPTTSTRLSTAPRSVRCTQSVGFDPSHPEDTSPFLHTDAAPLTYDGEGGLVLRHV